jgi:glycosyltransferase involved in cell wall biosynthesis
MSTRGVREAIEDEALSVLPVRVALLTNILLPHRVALLEAFAPLVRQLRIYLSAANEPDRKQPIDWRSLDVTLQRAIRWSTKFQNVHGFQDVSHTHIPFETYFQLQSYRPDVVISGEFGTRTCFACLYRITHPHTKLLVWATLSQRTEATRGRLRIALRRWILRQADACFVHGADGEGYLRQFGYAKPVFHIPYVTEERHYQGESIVPEDDITRIVYAGQLIERKGIYPFSAALCAWCAAHPERRVVFRVAGEGAERERLKTLQVPPSLTVEFLGHLDTAEISLAYRSASICAFPTLADEWGLVVNEALSAGLPVLASQHAQASIELIQEGYNGWIFDPYDQASLYSAMDRALSLNRSALRTMASNAQASVADWTPQAVATRMAAAIRRVASAERSTL